MLLSNATKMTTSRSIKRQPAEPALRGLFRSRCLGAGPPRRVACVAWRFCRAGRRGGVSTKNSRAKRARTSGEAARKIKLLPLQSPRGFSALARLYHLVRPTKTAMLRRLLAELKIFQVIGVYETKGIHK